MNFASIGTKGGTWYDVMQVCENGHKITQWGKSQPESLKNRCPECGASTITKCKKCDAEISGAKHISGALGVFDIKPPRFCEKCGTTFPWTEKQEGIEKKILDVQTINRIEKILERFHTVAKILEDRRQGHAPFQVNDEYDVQDLLHAILKIDFEDIRPEEWTPSYAGSCSRMDLLLKDEKIVIETKKTRDGLGSKDIGEQLLVDITKYEKHPDCKTLVCFVYDPERKIKNPSGLKKDLESKSSNNLNVKVWVCPK